MSSASPAHGVVRSYQRIFQPDRRLHQIEGHRIPIPGGVPLTWLGYATAALLTVLVLSGRSVSASVLIAAAASAFAIAVGGRRVAPLVAAVVFLAAQLTGALLGVLDWPLRLVVVPGVLATVGTQATPDGRSAHRYAASWLALQVRPVRRLLGRALPVETVRRLTLSVGLAPDHRGPVLRRGVIVGPATVTPSGPVVVREGRWPWNRGRATITQQDRGSRSRDAWLLSDPLALRDGERLEVRS